jgi:hypothetical protein
MQANPNSSLNHDPHCRRVSMIHIRPIVIVTGWMLLGVVTLLSPSVAYAGCAQWDISGHWEIQQGNGITVSLDLTQTGTEVRGTGSFATRPSSLPMGGFGASYKGSITGTIASNAIILLNAEWGGVYRGGVASDASIGGTTFATNDPGNQVTWRGNRPAICPEPTATTPPSSAEPNKPVKVLGKIKRTVTDLGNGETEYTYPTVTTSSGSVLPLDWCRVWASDCGKGAADVYCRQQGYQAAARFTRFNGMQKTWVIDDKKECDGPCASFKSIVCTKVAAGGGAEYATAITPATVYVEPGGDPVKDANGDDLAMPVGSKALVLKKQDNPVWYKVQTTPVGWVWGDDVTLGP